jgi:WD40 repeat protein
MNNPVLQPLSTVTPSSTDDAKTLIAPPSSSVGSETSDVATLLRPVVPDHELLRCIGRGSYGEVWLARNVMGYYRAVKFVYRSTFEHDRPFEREYDGIRRFEPVSRSHPSQLAVLHVGRSAANHYFYYVMELADPAGPLDGAAAAGTPSRSIEPGLGHRALQEEVPLNPDAYTPRTLAYEVRKRGRLPLAECLDIALKLTTALTHLHEHGLVHRDIKPSNIVFVNGVPKLADIGLVTDADSTMSYVGTLGFIPPEGPGTAQADIYSLAKVLYEISTGQDRNEFPNLPTGLNEVTDEDRLLEFHEALLKAGHSDPKLRYQSAEEMHADLLVLQAGESVRRLRQIERRWAIAKKVAAVGAALAVLTGAVLFQTARGKARATERVVRLNVANGTRLMNEGDLYGALLWFAEALRLDAGKMAREEPHRIRIAAVLRQCPKLLNVFSHGTQMFYGVFSPDNQRLVTTGDEHMARLWDANTGQLLHALPHNGEVYRPAFSADGARLITPSADGAARLWDALTGQLLLTLRQPGNMRAVAFSPDGRTVATGNSRGTVQLWDSQSGQAIGAPIQQHDAIDSLFFSPNGQYLRCATVEDAAALWDITRRRQIGGTLRNTTEIVRGEYIFTPDSRRFLTVEDGRVIVRDTQTGDPVLPPMEANDNVRTASFSPDGQCILTATINVDPGHTSYAELETWDAATGKPKRIIYRQMEYFHGAMFSPDSRRIVSVGADNTARVFDAATGEQLAPPLKHIVMSTSAQFSPDGRRLLTRSCDNGIRLWDLARSDIVEAHAPAPSAGAGILLSRDGRILLVSEETNLCVRLAGNGQPAYPPMAHPDPIRFATFSPDGRTILSECEPTGVGASQMATLFLWDAATGKQINREVMHHKYHIYCAAFSPDRRWVATGGLDYLATVWDAKTGHRLHAPFQHSGRVEYLAFSPDSRLLVTSTLDRQVRVWDVATGHPVTSPLKHGALVKHVEFDRSGHKLYTLSDTGLLQTWDLDRGEPLTPPRPTRPPGAEYVSTAQTTWDVLPDRRPVNDLVALAQLLAVQRLDADGSPVPLALAELKEGWDAFKHKYPADFAAKPNEIAAWQEREIQLCAAQQDIAGEIFHLGWLSRMRPGDSVLGQRLASARAALAESVSADTKHHQPRGIPPRSPVAPASDLDLTKFFTHSPIDLKFNTNSAEMGALPLGLQTLKGTDFDVRGLIYFAAKSPHDPDLPERIEGVPVGRKCTRLHLLQGTGWEAADGTQIGHCVLHYEDGGSKELPIVYGRDLRNHWQVPSEPVQTDRAVVVWRGLQPDATAAGRTLQLFKNTQPNPRPGVPIQSIDFVSDMAFPAWMLFAVTVE